MIIRVIKV